MRRRSYQQAREHVGTRIFELREDAGLTQQQFAERLELSEQWVRRVESGRANPSLEALCRFAATLKIDVAALFERPTRQRRKRPGRPTKNT